MLALFVCFTSSDNESDLFFTILTTYSCLFVDYFVKFLIIIFSSATGVTGCVYILTFTGFYLFLGSVILGSISESIDSDSIDLFLTEGSIIVLIGLTSYISLSI